MIKVGDTVYVVYDNICRSAVYAKVKSIDRLYITLDNAHISEAKYYIDTRRSADDRQGYNCKATLYESKEHYEKIKGDYFLEKTYREVLIRYIKYIDLAELKELIDFINSKQK